MLSEEVIDKVVERLVNRIEEGNAYVLEQIGKSIKKIGTLSTTSAYQLQQVFKYGGDYEKIVKKLAKITELNVTDIRKIFNEVAKNDYRFAKQFYDYRGIQYIPYEENLALKSQVESIATLTANTYVNLSRTLGFAKRTPSGVIFTELSRVYQDTIDKAILSVSQGKTTFQEQMYKTIKELGESGLKTMNYGTNRSQRLDSAVRMNIKDGLRTLSNEMQQRFSKEFGGDGVEISVHGYPAPDHETSQGRQFSLEEYNKLNNGLEANDVKGRKYTLDHDFNGSYRPISTLNCYHKPFYIILGVSKPEYTDKQLKDIIQTNKKGFDYEGKHYSMYEGTQLQRKIETEIRNQKDQQIIAKASGDDRLVEESQQKISQLTRKYRELSQISGIPTKMQRMRVSGYKRKKVK